MKSLEALTHHKGVRSADRANMKRLLHQLKRGRPLSYQERLNVQAYLSRYVGYLDQADRTEADRRVE